MIIKDLSYSYKKGVEVINSFSYDFSNTGKIYIITGINGSGKTTLLKIMCGLFMGYHGIKSNTYKKLAAHLDFDGFEPNISIRNNYKMLNCKKNIDTELLTQVAGVMNFDIPLSVIFKKLSSGNKLKAKLIYLFLQKPDLLILDEPFNHLDDDSRERLIDYLNLCTKRNITTILATHNYEEISYRFTEHYKIDIPKLNAI